MGNNNATANLTEEESSNLETSGVSPLEPVPVETTQYQVFLAGEDNGGDKQKDRFSDGVTGKEAQETESQSKELAEDPKVENVEQEMHQNGLESLVMETDEQLQNQTSVAEGVETVCEATEVEESSMIGTQSVVSKLKTTEFVNEEKPCVIDEIVFASPSFYETVGTETKMINESLEEIVPAEEVVRLDHEIGMEQSTVFPKIEPLETLNLEHRVPDDENEVTNDGKADQEISEPCPQESNAILENGFEVYKEEKDMKLGREAGLKRMSRCRSLPVSHNSRVMAHSLVQQLVSEVTFPSRNNMGLDKANMSEILLVSCLQINKVQETIEAITESSNEARVEMLSPSFSNDLRIKERSNESTEETPLLSQEKSEVYKATHEVEEKTVMLKRSETEKTRGLELSLGLSMKTSGRSDADDSFKETKGSGDNLSDKKAHTSETLLVSCVGSSNSQETTEVINESNKEALIEMPTPSFGNDLRTKERRNESTEQIPLLCQDKIEMHEATIDVEKKTVMLKRSESERTRGFELSLGLSMKSGEKPEADETKDSGDNLLDKKPSWGSMKGRVRKRSKSSLFGTCLCCATAMN